MGFWSSLGKGLLGAIPIVGPAIAGTIESVQASKASNAQQQAAGQAQQVAGQVYGQQQGLYAPYYTAGASALGQLTGLAGLPAPGTVLPASASLGAAGGTPQTAVPAPTRTPTNQSTVTSTPGSQPMSLASMSASSYGNQAQSSMPRMVTLQSPDGAETQQVPESAAPWYIQQGARRVS